MKKIVLSVIVIILFLGVAVTALFYFFPIPKAVPKDQSVRKIERCLYAGGIGHYVRFGCTDCGSSFYSLNGELLGHSGSFSPPPSESSPCSIKTKKICLPIFSNIDNYE